MQGWERAIKTLSVQFEDLGPTIPTHREKEDMENSRRQKGNEQPMLIKKHRPCA